MPTKRKEAVKEVSSTPNAPAKKSKKDPMAEQFREIIGAWEIAPVTEEVKKMLAEILPCSLGEFSDKRHKFQDHVIEAVAGVMAEAEAEYNKQINDTRAQHGEALAAKPLRETEASEATSKLDASRTETQRLKVILAETAQTFRARTASLVEAEDAKKADAQKSQEAGKKKGDFETALEDLGFLKTVSAEEARGKQDELITLLKRYKFEESMLIALPAALSKSPDARGQFDMMAVSQLEGEISKKIAEQESILIAAKPDQEKCEAVVQEAQEHLNKTRAEQRAAAKNFDTASKHQVTCEEAEKAAQKAMRALTSSLKRLESSVYAAEAELELFQQGPMETFKTLRSRITPPPVVEEEIAAPAAVEEEEEREAMEVQPAEEVPMVAAC